MNRNSRPVNETSLPIYQHIVNDMREKIVTDRWFAGMMLPSRDNLAKEYSVAVGTIQRAVGCLVKEGVLRTDPRRGTFVVEANGNAFAHMSIDSTPNSRFIAALLSPEPLPSHPFNQAITIGANDTLINKATSLVTFNTLANTWRHIREHESHAIEAISRDHLSGAIIWYSGSEETLQDLQCLEAKGIPLVYIDRYPMDVDCDFVGIDNFESAKNATEYLIDHGHKHIGFIESSEKVSTVQLRKKGYYEALERAELPALCDNVQMVDYTSSTVDVHGAIIEHYLSLPNPPTAYLITNDNLAYTFIYHLSQHGIHVPDQVSILSFDDIDRFSPRPPFLTTVHQPLELIGKRAAELLLERIENPLQPGQARKHILLPTHIVERCTCRQI